MQDLPQEIAHGTVVRDFLLPVDGADLVQRLYGRGEAAVDAEDFTVDDGAERKIVEDLGTIAPDRDRPVFSEAFVVETVD